MSHILVSLSLTAVYVHPMPHSPQGSGPSTLRTIRALHQRAQHHPCGRGGGSVWPRQIHHEVGQHPTKQAGAQYSGACPTLAHGQVDAQPATLPYIWNQGHKSL